MPTLKWASPLLEPFHISINLTLHPIWLLLIRIEILIVAKIAGII